MTNEEKDTILKDLRKGMFYLEEEGHAFMCVTYRNERGQKVTLARELPEELKPLYRKWLERKPEA